MSLPGSGRTLPGQPVQGEQDVGPGVYHVYEVSVAICAEQAGLVIDKGRFGGRKST